MYQIPRHRVFISFHHQDQVYKDWFVHMMGSDIVDESVGDGDIDNDNLDTDTIRQWIRDNFIRDATVTIVLIGPCTWQRKHVDWEIGSSLRATRLNSRCGLLCILLPNHPDAEAAKYRLNLVPPRVADNVGGDDPYAVVYRWSYNPIEIRDWIHRAYERRTRTPPDNSRQQYRYNRSGPCSDDWHN
jgi:hypothetical protein